MVPRDGKNPLQVAKAGLANATYVAWKLTRYCLYNAPGSLACCRSALPMPAWGPLTLLFGMPDTDQPARRRGLPARRSSSSWSR